MGVGGLGERIEGLFTGAKDQLMDLAERALPSEFLPLVSALISATAILIFTPLTMMFLTWLERKVVARFQDRYGPNRVGPFGLIQPIADGIKMILKEDTVPSGADKVIHHLVPVFCLVPVLGLYLVVPFGQGMVAADLNVGILFFLAMSSIQTPLVIAAGWGTRSKFSVLGSMRAAAQILSYEIPMVLVVVAVVMMAGTMSTCGIVAAQAKDGWFALTPWGAFGALIFLVAATAEANRTPFDMAEAESELVAGFHTEYSGFKFALFQMSEFLSAFAAAAIAATVFFGGWLGPSILPSWAWLTLKAYVIFFILIWFRATLPRFRIDQLLAIAWKFLFPLSLLVLLAAAIWHYFALGPALAVSLALLVGGYLGFSFVLEREFGRMNVPRRMA